MIFVGRKRPRSFASCDISNFWVTAGEGVGLAVLKQVGRKIIQIVDLLPVHGPFPPSVQS